MCDIKRKKEQKIKVAFSFVFAHQEHSKTNHEISKKRVVILWTFWGTNVLIWEKKVYKENINYFKKKKVVYDYCGRVGL